MSEHYGSFCPCCGSAEHRAMGGRTFLSLIAGTATGLAIPSAFADTQPAPSIAYDSIADPVRLPRDTFFGECSGVALNSRGHIFVLSRGNTSGPAYGAAAAQLLEFDPAGQFVRRSDRICTRGRSRSGPGGSRDNIWVADKGSDMVVDSTPDG